MRTPSAMMDITTSEIPNCLQRDTEKVVQWSTALIMLRSNYLQDTVHLHEYNAS